jgi:hypothetical protein
VKSFLSLARIGSFVSWRIGADRPACRRLSPLHGRAGPAAVWTGRQMIVWGGSIPRHTTTMFYTDGANYTP